MADVEPTGAVRALDLALEHASLGSVLDALVRTVEATSEHVGAILLLDQDGVHLRHVAAPSLPDVYKAAIDGALLANRSTVALAQGLHTCLEVPIVSRRGDVLGTFALYGTTPTTTRAQELVELVSRTAALVIERDRERHERRVAELELARQVAALTRIHTLALRLARLSVHELAAKLVEILAAAAELHATTCGLLSVQHPATGALEVAASLNFPREALEIVREITPSPTATACGSAFAHAERTIVEDTETDPRFVGYRRIARKVGFRSVHSTPIYTRQGALLGVISLHNPNPGRPSTLQIQLSDLCALHAADAIEAARASERLSDLADNMAQHAWIADERGAITWFNGRWFEYTGTHADDDVGWGWTRVHHPDHVQRVVATWQRAWDTGVAWEDTFPLRGKDGTYRWFLARAQPIRDERGRVVRWFGTHTDITAQRETQTALEAASRAKDHFLAALSHELRTPLSPILMAATVLERSLELPHVLRGTVAMIRRNVELETKLIDDLLDLSRITSGKLSLAIAPIAIAETVDDVLEICRAQLDDKALRVTFSHDGEGVVLADPARL
ncbi:MAG: GAF domain-containing protein, partial [Proteobacteria bacterium]|nr:GAF domain-containing protein [Pseudomonadota bacterium]